MIHQNNCCEISSCIDDSMQQGYVHSAWSLMNANGIAIIIRTQTFGYLTGSDIRYHLLLHGGWIYSVPMRLGVHCHINCHTLIFREILRLTTVHGYVVGWQLFVALPLLR